jgi:ketosteroid isomerase-like protein
MGRLRELVEQHYRGISTGDLHLGTSVFADDVVTVAPGAPEPFVGRHAFRDFARAFITGFPDARLELRNVVAETDNTIVVEGTFSGTHDGPLVSPTGEIQPTGQLVEVPFVDIFVANGDKIVEHRVYYDQLALLGQLGLSPS